jgi:vacuolar-type H+-ATPase subunit C/Vma6
LPLHTLDRLARATTVADFARDLLRCGHPAGRVLEHLGRQSPPPALRDLEWALTRLFSERAVRAARGGGSVVRRFAADLVDQENLWTLLLSAPPAGAPNVDQEFLPGGGVLTREVFVRLRAERDGARLVAELRRCFTGTAIGTALARDPVEWASLEARILAARITWLRGAARRDPLGPAVVLSVLERIRTEARALRAIAWGVAFGAPPATLASLMTEAA